MRLRWLAAGLVGISVLSIAGCSSSIAVDSYEGTPSGVDLSLENEITATWVDEAEGLFAISMLMSSSCPTVPVAITAAEPDTVVVEVETPGLFCTADQAPGTFVLEAPSEVANGVLNVSISTDGSIYPIGTLPPRE